LTTPAAVVCIGLDLAWKATHPTGGAALVDGELAAWTASLGDNDAVVAWVGQWVQADTGLMIAVDAPLRVPNMTGARRCDVELSRAWGRYRAGAHPANRARLAEQGVIRGEELVAQLAAAFGVVEQAPPVPGPGRRLVCEVYPHPAHVSLFGLAERLRYKAKTGWGYATRWAGFAAYQAHLAALVKADPPLRGADALLSQSVVGLRGKALKAQEDALDALTCAYVAAYLWRHGPQGAHVYGTVAEGHIVVPRVPAVDVGV
jgi:predicted RNase H-like nuclease